MEVVIYLVVIVVGVLCILGLDWYAGSSDEKDDR